MIKTFKGILVDGGQDRIRLGTMKGKVGYRIVKFEIFPNLPGTVDLESTVAIWKVQQTSVSTTTATVDFSDQTLLGVAYLHEGSPLSQANTNLLAVFDKEVFNQDIYITHIDTNHLYACNYYIELEVMPLDDLGAEYTTIKDLRTRGF